METPQTYEQAVRELEEIVKQLEQKSQSLALDETIRLYKRGVELERFCRERLRLAEAELQKVAPADETTDDAPF